jgi:hypothetical protein
MINNKSGFSLVEILVAAGLLGAVSLGVMRLTENTNKASKHASQKFETLNTLSSIRSLLSSGDVCKANFNEMVLSDDMQEIESLSNASGRVMFNKVDKYGNGAIKIKSMRFGKFDPYRDEIEGTNYLGRGTLQITFERLGHAFGTKEMTKNLRLSVRVNDPIEKKLVDCSAQTSSGGLWSHGALGIHYNSGYVGVGTSRPKRTFHVEHGFEAQGILEEYPYVGQNMGIVVENANDKSGANAGVGIVTTSNNANSAIQFSTKGIPEGGWSGIISYDHKNDSLAILSGRRNGNAALPGRGINIDSKGRLRIGFDKSYEAGGDIMKFEEDALYEQFTLDVKSQKINGGSGIRVIGNETTAGEEAAKIVLDDKSTGTKWAISGQGAAGVLAGGFTIGHRNVGKYIFSITNDDKVGIHTTAPTKDFEVLGDSKFTGEVEISSGELKTENIASSGKITATEVSVSSDATLKENILPIDSALKNLLKIKGVSYRWKEFYNHDQRRKLGVIAQDVQKVFPEAVNDRGEYLAVNYNALIAPLVESIRELSQQLNKQNTEIKKLKDALLRKKYE